MPNEKIDQLIDVLEKQEIEVSFFLFCLVLYRLGMCVRHNKM